ncbi:MAG: 4-(cytidine 5'-diphospho)-2-C-methyl-D-erythritol kinase [Actinobacteria bacterium]|nr:4-(cytidine 5'-diphospho)-2-C-methyl-D-erythritol kinase [Actinomycetota bacterium]
MTTSDHVSATIGARVPAKINLFLAVRGLRRDGYHEIVTILHTVELFDQLSVRLEGSRTACYHPAARRLMEIEFEHDAGHVVPGQNDNLVVRAAQLLVETLGPPVGDDDVEVDRPVTRIHLHKAIPVAAGMAGGSADAAATLVALNHLWDCGLTADELRELGGELGADVPFCVTGGTALATGTGASTAQVLSRGWYDWVIAIDDRPLATQDVYGAWDEHCEPSEVEPDAVLHALRTEDPEALGAALHNDLQEAVFALRPDLRDRRQALLDADALGAVVTGSGPTVVALAAGPGHAADIAAEIGGSFDRVLVVRSPAGGPELLQDRTRPRDPARR